MVVETELRGGKEDEQTAVLNFIPSVSHIVGSTTWRLRGLTTEPAMFGPREPY